MPFRASGSGLPGDVALPPRYRLSTPLLPRGTLASATDFGFPSTRPVATGTCFSEPRRRSPTSATEFDARTRPTSRGSSHASEAFTSVPARAPGRGMPVALASAVRCRTGSLRAAICTRRLAPSRSTCVDEAGHGPEHSSKGYARSWKIARALLVGPRAPGSPARLTPRPGRPGDSAHRPRLFLDDTSRKVTPSRESRCLLSRQNPYASEGLLPRARPDRCPVTRPPWRRCSGADMPFLPPPDALF
jgi:hypothetical protein